jgi:hypothetical protein
MKHLLCLYCDSYGYRVVPCRRDDPDKIPAAQLPSSLQHEAVKTEECWFCHGGRDLVQVRVA